MNNIYRFEKFELPVMIFQADGSIMKGVVFLSPCASAHNGQQTLADLLREQGAFFPFRCDSGSFCVTNKATITHLRFDPVGSGLDNAALGDQLDVQITFVGGEQLLGTIVIEMPEGRNRLYDFINAVKGFFPLSTPEAHYLVNIALVRDISPIEAC